MVESKKKRIFLALIKGTNTKLKRIIWTQKVSEALKGPSPPCSLLAYSTQEKKTPNCPRLEGQTSISTYTPGHEVGEAPVVLLVEEQVTDAAAEGLLVIFVVDNLQHGLRVA